MAGLTLATAKMELIKKGEQYIEGFPASMSAMKWSESMEKASGFIQRNQRLTRCEMNCESWLMEVHGAAVTVNTGGLKRMARSTALRIGMG